MQLQLSLHTSLPIMRCSNTVGSQLLPQCWLTWAPGTVGKVALGTRMSSAEGQAAQPLCNIPNPRPGQITTVQPVSCAHIRGSQLLWCPGCWLGSAWQAHGFPFARTLELLCSLRWAGRAEDIFPKPHSLWNKAARLFCPKVILYTALRSHTGSGQTRVHQVRSLWIPCS